MTALPLTVGHRAGEPAFSLLSRLAARNFCATDEFCNDMGIDWVAVLAGEPESIAQVADLSGASAETLMATTPRHLDSRRTMFHGMVINRARLSGHDMRCCLACLAEDFAGQGGEATNLPSIRAELLHDLTFVCPRHGIWLTTIWSEGDIPDGIARPDLPKLIGIMRRGQSIGLRPMICGWRHGCGGQRGSTWLDRFDFQAATDVCDLLGRSLVRDKFPQLRDMTDVDRHAAICAAFDILSKGEEAFRAVLSKMQRGGGSPNDGPSRRFGVLYANLDRYLTGPAYEPFRAILRDHIFQTWPIASGQAVLGEILPARRLHSVVTASKETGVPRDRLRAMLAANGYVTPRGQGTFAAWELFDANGAKDFLARAAKAVTLKDILTLLNMSKSQVDTLRAAGFLKPSFEGDGLAPLWDPDEAQAFLSGLLDDAVQVSDGDPEWEQVSAAGLRLRVPPGEILQMRLDGRLSCLGRLQGAAGYRSLMVNTNELIAARSSTEDLLNMETFAKAIGLRWPAARRLVMLGLTPSTELRNPASGAMQRYITPADLRAFHQRYATLLTLSAELGRAWQGVSHLLKVRQAPRVQVDGRDFGQLYAREDLGDVLQAATLSPPP
ncbi:TniQ family protein [Paracoccus sp. (in: a-proteobacteria)]|uniref:TniQ family protein n=1 Tax=Paracoccus sp. TaxID=267 RepID=UPI0028A8C72C|nr:TniQ family protein [Paracoccus sp. (in: a-proteobacteria)]